MKIKKNLFKTGGAMLAGLLLCASLFGAVGAVGLRARAEEEPIPIDMYLIAGQSNAAGYSHLDKGYSSLTGTTGNTVSGTFNNVWYGGEIDKNYQTQSAPQSWLSYSSFKKYVTTGYGRSAFHMGPEFGIAEKLNEIYTGEKKAFIFKSAAGGTSLFDNLPGGTENYGNWYPRSAWSSGKAVTTGMQYENFLNNFTKVYGELKNNGYAPKVRAMIWMQGEADLGNPTGYESVIKTFIRDIREDLSEAAEDDTLADMPFIMGEISLTYGYLNNPHVPAFVEMQRRVAESMEGVYTVYTGDLSMRDGSGNIVGSDEYHWSAPDMRMLGNRFGEQALEVIKEDKPSPSNPITKTGRGDVTCEDRPDGSILITLTPAEGYRLTLLSVNGEDVTGEVSDGTYTIPAGTAIESIVVTFSKEHAVPLVYEYEESEVTVTGPSSSQGGEITVTVTPKEGYEVLSVTYYPSAAFGSVIALTRVGDTDEYTLAGVEYAGRIVVVTKSLAQEPPEGGASGGGTEPKKGCQGSIGAGAAVLVAAASLLFVKRKEK